MSKSFSHGKQLLWNKNTLSAVFFLWKRCECLQNKHVFDGKSRFPPETHLFEKESYRITFEETINFLSIKLNVCLTKSVPAKIPCPFEIIFADLLVPYLIKLVVISPEGYKSSFKASLHILDIYFWLKIILDKFLSAYFGHSFNRFFSFLNSFLAH